MKTTPFVAPILSAIAAFSAADACTTAAVMTLESSFSQASGVVLAEVSDAARAAASNNLSDPYPVESVTFKVLVAWKGIQKPGSILKFETAIGPGSCGMSIDPEMRLLVAAPAKKLDSGGIWILFLNGSAPYGLEDPSGKVGAGAERNLGRLLRWQQIKVSRPRSHESNNAFKGRRAKRARP